MCGRQRDVRAGNLEENWEKVVKTESGKEKEEERISEMARKQAQKKRDFLT